MVQNTVQDKISPNETIEDVNKIIRDEIKKAFETVNIPAATTSPTKPENSILQDNDVYNDLTNGLVEDVIRALKNNNTEEAITRLTLADQQITATAGNQTSKLFIERAIRSIKNNNTKEAITTLKLAYGM
jgi:predicted house-cleaning noncanonical NTP pyrophosphatase (MazG superfamily)